MGGQPLVQTCEQVPIDLRVGDIDVVVVRLLDGLEVEHPDVALHHGPVEGVLDLLRPGVAVIAVAVLEVIPHGEHPDGVEAGPQGHGVHAGLHDVLPLDVGFNEADGDMVVRQVVQGEVHAVVVAQDGLAAGDDIVGNDAVLLIAPDHGLGVLRAVVAVVAQGAGDHLQPGGLDALYLFRHEAQGDVQQLGGAQLFPLDKALVLGVGVGALAAVEGVGGGAVQEDIRLVGGIAHAEIGPRREPGLHGLDQKEDRVKIGVVGDLHDHIEAVEAPGLDLLDEGVRVAVPPARILHDLAHHGGGDVQRGVLHQGGEVFLGEAHLGDAHIFEFVQPPGHVAAALLGHPLQFDVVEDHIVGFIFVFHLPAGGDDKDADDDRQGRQAQEDSVSLHVLLHLRSFLLAAAGRRGLSSYFTFAPAGAGPSFRASEKKQKVAQGTTFLENPPSLRG